MRLDKTLQNAGADDEGVSPVIAVILMVAITVVLAATVYVWVSGFASDDTGPEQASATAKGVDLNDDGDVEWAKLTLTKGNNAPYDHGDVTISATYADGSSADTICRNATGPSCSGDDVWDGTSDRWKVGQSLWIPCSATSTGETLTATVSVRESTILDSTISCEADA